MSIATRAKLSGLFFFLAFFSFVFGIVAGMLHGSSWDMPEYYADESSYVELECRVIEAYPAEEYLKLSREQGEITVVFWGNCQDVVVANGFYDEVEPGDTVVVGTAPRGESCAPIVSLRRGDKVYLDDKTGRQQILEKSREYSARAKRWIIPAFAATGLFSLLTVIFFLLWCVGYRRLHPAGEKESSDIKETGMAIAQAPSAEKRRYDKGATVFFSVMAAISGLMWSCFGFLAIERYSLAERYDDPNSYEEIVCRIQRRSNACYFEHADGISDRSEIIRLDGENLEAADRQSLRRELKDGELVIVIRTLPVFRNEMSKVVGLRTEHKVYLESEIGIANLVVRERELSLTLWKGALTLTVIFFGNLLAAVLCRRKSRKAKNTA